MVDTFGKRWPSDLSVLRSLSTCWRERPGFQNPRSGPSSLDQADPRYYAAHLGHMPTNSSSYQIQSNHGALSRSIGFPTRVSLLQFRYRRVQKGRTVRIREQIRLHSTLHFLTHGRWRHNTRIHTPGYYQELAAYSSIRWRSTTGANLARLLARQLRWKDT